MLVDLILSRSGWARLAKLGGTTEGIDIEAENASAGEIAFVQVKSSATQATLRAASVPRAVTSRSSTLLMRSRMPRPETSSLRPSRPSAASARTTPSIQ